MQIVIITVGKRPESTVQALIDDYEKRLLNDYQVQWLYIAASKFNDKLQSQN